MFPQTLPEPWVADQASQVVLSLGIITEICPWLGAEIDPKYELRATKCENLSLAWR